MQFGHTDEVLISTETGAHRALGHPSAIILVVAPDLT